MRLIDADANDVSESLLTDWYISSVDDKPPVWTEEHINELKNDFYVIPKRDDIIGKIPIIEAKPIIRCKDCKYWSEPNMFDSYCRKMSITDNIIYTEPNHYCGFAERISEKMTPIMILADKDELLEKLYDKSGSTTDPYNTHQDMVYVRLEDVEKILEEYEVKSDGKIH